MTTATAATAAEDDWIAYRGARMVGEKASLPKLWTRLHDNAVQWTIMCKQRAKKRNLDALNNIDLELMQMLSNCTDGRWIQLCKGAGETVPGAIGLSWCDDARIEDVWSMWFESGVPLGTDPVSRRFARLLNPALIEDVSNVSGLLRIAEKDVFLACVCLLRAEQPLIWDVSGESMQKAPDALAEFMLREFRHVESKPPSMQAFVDHWSARMANRNRQAVRP